MKKFTKVLLLLLTVLTMAVFFCIPAFAEGGGNVSGAIKNTWNSASSEVKDVVDSVVFPIIDVVLAVFFFAKLGLAYFDYRKSGHFEWAAPAILFACLVFMLTAPTYIWTIVNI